MKQKSVIKVSAVALALSMVSTVQAAQVVDTSKQNFKTLKQQFVIGKSSQLLASHPDGLKVLSARSDSKKNIHTRMQQTFYNYPVIGGYTISHVKSGKSDLAAAKTSLNGNVYTGLANELSRPTKELVVNQTKALAQAKQAYAGKAISEEKSSLVVFMDENHQAHWAYQVSFVLTHMDKIPERPTSIIDAKSMEVLLHYNDMKTHRSQVKGIGYGGNERTGKYVYGDKLAALELTRDDEEQVCFMETDSVKVVDMDHGYYSDNKPMKFDCTETADDSDDAYWTGYNADGLDEINQAYSPTNDAMYAGYVIKHLYRDWYGLEVLNNSDGTPMQLVMRVHYGSRYENAFWNGKNMTFGDGGSWMYPLVSLGVGAHEISHGFTEQNANLQYWGQSGGMNESFSDMAAQAAEYYSTGKASWLIGERIMKEASGYDALRYMEQPSKDGRSIDTAEDYYNGLDVHYSSGVYNRLYYLMSNQEGWDARKAFDVMVKANQDYWTPYATYKTAACGVLSAAADLGYDVDSIKAIMQDKVLIDISACEDS